MYNPNFGDIVVVEGGLVGVAVKCWAGDGTAEMPPSTEVYVRSYNRIKTYYNKEIKQFIYDKELSEESLEFYKYK